MKAVVSKSPNPEKKYKIELEWEDRKKTIHIGQANADDMTIHKDPNRKRLYITRHKKRENWTKSGVFTPGFWSRWLTWNKDTLKKSAKDIEERFKISVMFKK